MVDALERLRADVARGALPARARRRGRAHRPRARADRARGRRPRRQAARGPLAQRPDRHAGADVPAPRGPRARRRWCSTSSTRSSRRPTAAGDAPMPGRTHLQHAQPVLLAHHLLAHAWPLLRDVERWLDWDARAARLAVRLGRARRARRSAWTRPRSPRSSGFDGPVENSIDGTASRDVVAEFAFVAAMLGRRHLAARRGGHPLGDQGVRLRARCTTPTPRGRASCRRRRTRTSPSSPAARPGASSAT